MFSRGVFKARLSSIPEELEQVSSLRNELSNKLRADLTRLDDRRVTV